MTKTKTVWKVVSYNDGKRYSAVVDLYHGGIKYNKPGKRTRAPKGTRLLAFKTKREALIFSGEHFSEEVWKAEAKDVKVVHTLYSAWAGSRSRFVSFWQGVLASGRSAPIGSVSCSELTLIKKV